MLDEARMTPEEAETIYRMTSLARFNERFVIPPFMREQAIESVQKPSRIRKKRGSGSPVLRNGGGSS